MPSFPLPSSYGHTAAKPCFRQEKTIVLIAGRSKSMSKIKAKVYSNEVGDAVVLRQLTTVTLTMMMTRLSLTHVDLPTALMPNSTHTILLTASICEGHTIQEEVEDRAGGTHSRTLIQEVLLTQVEVKGLGDIHHKTFHHNRVLIHNQVV